MKGLKVADLTGYSHWRLKPVEARQACLHRLHRLQQSKQAEDAYRRRLEWGIA